MKIVGCDLHARQQSIALCDSETGDGEPEHPYIKSLR